MKQPEFVRGALFASHAHTWNYVGTQAWVHFYFVVRGAIVWRKRRRVSPV